MFISPEQFTDEKGGCLIFCLSSVVSTLSLLGVSLKKCVYETGVQELACASKNVFLRVKCVCVSLYVPVRARKSV